MTCQTPLIDAGRVHPYEHLVIPITGWSMSLSSRTSAEP